MQPSPTNQHYVPQFLLRGFASGRQKQVYCLDKQTGRVFKTRTRNVAAQTGFYDIEVNGEKRSIDPLLTDLEERAAPIVHNILQVKHLRFLTEELRYVLGLFVVCQMLRTDCQRQRYKHINDIFCEAIINWGGDPNNVEGFRPLSDKEARREFITILPKLAMDMLPNILNKTWVLYSAPPGAHFFSSDNPVSMHNTMNKNPHRGTLGVGVRGIEIYLPLSASLCLGLLCRSIETMIRDGENRAKRVGAPVTFSEWIRAFDQRTPLDLEPLNVTHHNSLQVINAERYVFSHDGGFGLAEEMLESNPELRSGPRMEVAR